jgi:16S rRNA (guanine(966)-N(2))-methyltransferase RsmD
MRGGPLRIIAGELRGRRIGKPAPGVRPTSDRVRESLFARLGDVAGDRVLDLFAGTGALGIEAISRGAERATFVDRSARVIASLERTLEQFGIETRAEVIKGDARGVARRLAEKGACFDLVLLDPPYADHADVAPLLEEIAGGGLLAPRGVVVVECAKRHALPPDLAAVPGLEIEGTRTYGDTSITWLTREHPA